MYKFFLFINNDHMQMSTQSDHNANVNDIILDIDNGFISQARTVEQVNLLLREQISMLSNIRSKLTNVSNSSSSLSSSNSSAPSNPSYTTQTSLKVPRIITPPKPINTKRSSSVPSTIASPTVALDIDESFDQKPRVRSNSAMTPRVFTFNEVSDNKEDSMDNKENINDLVNTISKNTVSNVAKEFARFEKYGLIFVSDRNLEKKERLILERLFVAGFMTWGHDLVGFQWKDIRYKVLFINIKDDDEGREWLQHNMAFIKSRRIAVTDSNEEWVNVLDCKNAIEDIPDTRTVDEFIKRIFARKIPKPKTFFQAMVTEIRDFLYSIFCH